ncbi:patatin-like phospholipase family protein [uncultured Clostridium sp.]|uniref:patatin-like phospholipase family protein n=1 Tax=uncultured Clostridium sp. TaxID=59620 RepID=UPI0034C61465
MVKGGTREYIKKIDFNKIKNLNINGYATCTSIPEIRAKYFKFNENSTEDIKNILYATSAVPLIYDSAIINNVSYLDGGIVDNVPIQPVYGEGCDVIIVVKLSVDSYIDIEKYPNTKIIEINSLESEGADLRGMMDLIRILLSKE